MRNLYPGEIDDINTELSLLIDDPEDQLRWWEEYCEDGYTAREAN